MRIEYAQFLHDASELQLKTEPSHSGQCGEIPKRTFLLLPVKPPSVEIPVAEMFLKD